MLFSANRLTPGLAAASGIGAFAMPLITPWHLLTVLMAAVAVSCSGSGRQRGVFGAIAFFSVLLVLLGYLPSPLAAASLSCAALAMTGRVNIAVGVVLLNLSAIASVQELLSDQLHHMGMDGVTPSILASTVLVITSAARLHAILAVIGGLLATGTVGLVSWYFAAPESVLAIGALPVVIAAAVISSSKGRHRRLAIPVTVLITALFTWFWSPPRTAGEVWVLLPAAPSAYEAKFFRNYIAALQVAGVPAKKAGLPTEIPRRSTVLIPWLTEGFADDKNIGELARERSWTVVVGGEHTNMGEVASRIETMSGVALLRRDLTVPPLNSDDSGPLRLTALNAWPHQSIFNRGASVTIASPTDKILLAGDGWWAEPDIGEWLWVGDYIWRPGDRFGRLALAAASDISGARWIVIGDNSPLINRQLIADPRAALHILQAASLWPAFVHDALIALMILAALAGFNSTIALLPLISVSLMTIVTERPSQAWGDMYVGESGFDERNFNNALADNPALLDGRRLIRVKSSVSGTVKLPDGAATMFLLVDGSVNIANVKLDDCHRLGALASAEGPYLMDAQACRVDGTARVLIGSKAAAAAIAVPNNSTEIIIILDAAFLSQKAPKINVEWLLNEVSK